MARKKEYTLEGESSNVANKRGSKVTDVALNDSHKKLNGNRAKLLAKNKEGASAGTSARNVYDVGDLRAQLGSFGLTVRDIPGDGNCLFRALGDQLDGHTGNHVKHRLDTVRYMIAHKGHFEPFIDAPFDRYVLEMSRPGTYAGQDAIVAFARLHKVNIVIHQLNRPLWKIQGSENNDAPELHLSYHNGEHYSSVRRFGDIADTPAGIRIMGPATVPCCASHTIFTSTKPITTHADSENYAKICNQVQELNQLTNQHIDLRRKAFIRDENDFVDCIQEVMSRTGCRDTNIATEALIESGGDIGHAVDYLLSLALFFDPLEPDGIDKAENADNDVTLPGFFWEIQSKSVLYYNSECDIPKKCEISGEDLNDQRVSTRKCNTVIASKDHENYSNESNKKVVQEKPNNLSFLTL